MNERPAIDLARFSELLDTCGSDPARFPEAERAAALALLERSPEARRLLRAAAALSDALDQLAVPEPSAALRRAVAEIPLRHPRPALSDSTERSSAWSPFRSLRAAALSAVLILVLGALSGALSAGGDADASTMTDDDWGDLASLTFAANLDQELAP
jgi:hypothetical protein